MAVSPEQNSEGPVGITIKSNGKTIDDEIAVISVLTRAEINRVPEAIISIMDGEPATGDFPVADADTFKPGAEIEIQVGYGSATHETVFKGIVTGVRLRLSQIQSYRLDVTCRHKAFKMLHPRKRGIYNSMRDSDVISRILADTGISATVDVTTAVHTALIRADCTDWDFLVSRAEVNALIVAAHPDRFTVAEPDANAAAKLEVTFGEDLIRTDIAVSAKQQSARITAAGWSLAEQKVISSNASAGKDFKLGNLDSGKLAEVGGSQEERRATSLPLTDDVLKAVTKGRQMREDLAHVIGTVEFHGSAKAVLSETLDIKNVGERFSGTGLICGIVHRIEDGDWITEVQLGNIDTWLSDATSISGPPAAAIALPTHGLAIGKVVKLDEDPAGQNRIQIMLPELDEGATPFWARLGRDYASRYSGTMFLPELDDEVIVGFFNEDPSSPVILGSLHNPKAQPPERFKEYDKDNNFKAFVTRAQLKIIFDEDKKVLTLETPAKNTVIMDDEQKSVTLKDQNGNSAVLDGNGISLKSASDMSFSAIGDISLEAQGSVAVSGVEITAAADTSLSLSGGSSAELRSSGVLTVQGSLVKIN